MTLNDRIPDIIERVDLSDLVSRYGGAQTSASGGTITYHCPHPGHEDRTPSFTVKGEHWKCWSQCDAGGDAIDFLVFMGAARDNRDAIEMLAGEIGLNRPEPTKRTSPAPAMVVAEYVYTDATGKPISKAVRYEPGRDGRPKSFGQFSPDSNGGWKPGLNGGPRVPYHLPQLTSHRDTTPNKWVFVVEGEKCVEALEALGITATCNSEGAGKFTAEHAQHFTGLPVAIIPDNDEVGRNHAQRTASELYGIASRLRIVELSDLPVKGDVVDWLASGGNREDLAELLKEAPDWTPPVEPIAELPTTDESPDTELRVPTLSHELASSVVITKPQWVWERWLARKMVHLCAGRQGSGKTTFVSWVAAQLVNGKALPGDQPRDPMRVGFLSLEESKDRVVARFQAAGAVLERVCVPGLVDDWDDEGNKYQRPWRMPNDIGVLGRYIEAHHIDLMVVDGIGYSIDGDTNSYSTVGRVLSALSKEAERTGAAILGLTHTPKGGSDAVTAAIGSTAWTALARIAWVLGPDQNDQNLKLVNVGKSNYKYPETGYQFEIHDHAETEAGYVAELQASAVTGDEITAAWNTPDERSATELATEFLRESLKFGSRPANEMEEAAKRQTFSASTLGRAKRKHGVKSINTGTELGWVWEPPAEWVEKRPNQAVGEECQPPLVAIEDDYPRDRGNLPVDQGILSEIGDSEGRTLPSARDGNLPPSWQCSPANETVSESRSFSASAPSRDDLRKRVDALAADSEAATLCSLYDIDTMDENMIATLHEYLDDVEAGRDK